MKKHPLSAALQQHLARYRGNWVKHLPLELRAALENIDACDLKRAATILIHGDPTCAFGRQRSSKRIKDGWKFCGNGSACPCFMEHYRTESVKTNMAKYGVKNAAQSEAVKATMRATCLERYGVEYSGASEERREKAEATNLARYGAKNVFASEQIKRQIREKTRAEHGVDHISQSSAHQAKMRQAITEKYGVEYISQHPDFRATVAATNTQRYGGVAPACSPDVTAKMRATMNERYGGHYGHLHIEPERRIVDEADFRARFTGRRAAEIAEETGYDKSLIYRYAEQWSVELDHAYTDRRGAENALAARLEAEGLSFERNRRLLVPTGAGGDRRRHQEIDIYFAAHKFGIELCGGFWHSDANGRTKNYHKEKMELAHAAGIDLIQIFEDEWVNHLEAVISSILHRIGISKNRVFARKCILTQVSFADASVFYDRYHVFGAVAATVHFGLTYEQALVACMSFTRRGEGHWELVRYATSQLVVGGASRLLNVFEHQYEWTTIVSFADLRWSQGRLYYTLGFTLDQILPPDYSYVIGDQRVHKFNLRKTSKRFAKYAGSGLTERQMAEAENIPRVYDAGKLRMIKRKV
jgi:hypothetical protein